MTNHPFANLAERILFLLTSSTKDAVSFLVCEAYSGPGPGGQNKNRSYTGVRLTDPILKLSATASVHRERPRNIAEALQGLRIQIVTGNTIVLPTDWKLFVETAQKHPLIDQNLWPQKISAENPNYPFLMCYLRAMLESAHGNLDEAVAMVECSKSRLLKQLATEKHVWNWFTSDRSNRGLPLLKLPR